MGWKSFVAFVLFACGLMFVGAWNVSVGIAGRMTDNLTGVFK